MRFRRRAPRDAATEPAAEGKAFEDAALVAAARGNPDAFEPLFRRYWDGVVRYCYYRLGDWPEAEDAANQTFADAYAALGRFQDRGGGFRSWLFVIAHNEVADRRLRRARRPEAPLETVAILLDSAPSPEDLAMTAGAMADVRALLVTLPERLRQVVELRLAGLSDREIAQVLGIGHDAVRQAQSRAVARLRDLLGVTVVGKGAIDG
jgi:RNA polymerase sigma-70 factor (ECF subfamily)